MSSPVDTILDVFESLSRTPRCSGSEEAVSAWLLSQASALGLEAKRDAARNVLISVPPTAGYEREPAVVIQGHMDMVCEKTPESPHDFSRDPIRPRRDGEWLRADGTTLGADNGIAIAIALALIREGVPHPPLELLFTVSEETGLTGAQSVDPEWLSGRVLLNLDSEEEGVFTVGCAGGRDTVLSLPVETVDPTTGLVARELAVSGLTGGHSGIDIHRNRANANALLARMLAGGGESRRLCSIGGGSARNAIARDASAVVLLHRDGLPAFERAATSWLAVFRREHQATDPGLAIAVKPCPMPQTVLGTGSERALVDLLLALPHGVVRTSDEVPGLVETSTNFATVRTEANAVEIVTSQRSSSATRIEAVAGQIEAIGRLAGATARTGSQYPGWEPETDSDLLRAAKALYHELFGREPEVRIIHAGLECGVIGSRCAGMQMLSFGPTITGAHSPAERLHLPSLDNTWRFLTAFLAARRAGS